MRGLALGLAFLIFSCTTDRAPNAQDKSEVKDEDKGPDVNALVKPDQDKWLKAQVKNPAQAQINRLLVLGDSLSDPGNLNKRTLGSHIPPRQFYKSRFSNGPIWSDYVQGSLGWTLSNFAVGGAETRSNGLIEKIVVPSFLEQISENKAEMKTMEFAKTLVAVWIGPNNYFIQSVKVQDANQNPVAEKLRKQVDDTINDIRKGIVQLGDIGFKQIVVGTMPELGGINRSPKDVIKASDATLYAATAAHNTALRAMLEKLRKDEPELTITLFQANEINQKTINDPKSFGFTRFDAPCYVGSLRGKFDGEKKFCGDPQGYKFWEYVHPNSKMHCYYASQFMADIAAAGKISGYDAAKALARCREL